jgi:hypothetical protein
MKLRVKGSQTLGLTGAAGQPETDGGAGVAAGHRPGDAEAAVVATGQGGIGPLGRDKGHDVLAGIGDTGAGVVPGIARDGRLARRVSELDDGDAIEGLRAHLLGREHDAGGQACGGQQMFVEVHVSRPPGRPLRPQSLSSGALWAALVGASPFSISCLLCANCRA